MRIDYYIREDESCPFTNWLDGLDGQAASKVSMAIARMEMGNFGDVKPVGKGVSERRITFGPGYRIYFGQDGDQLVLLLCGGSKKRQSRDIAEAQALWTEYKERKRKEAKDGSHT